MNYYASKNQQSPPPNEDIHHFYNRSPRPSINQNTIFTPHVSGRISTRNSQIVSPVIYNKNNPNRLSIAMVDRQNSTNYKYSV